MLHVTKGVVKLLKSAILNIVSSLRPRQPGSINLINKPIKHRKY